MLRRLVNMTKRALIRRLVWNKSVIHLKIPEIMLLQVQGDSLGPFIRYYGSSLKSLFWELFMKSLKIRNYP